MQLAGDSSNLAQNCFATFLYHFIFMQIVITQEFYRTQNFTKQFMQISVKKLLYLKKIEKYLQTTYIICCEFTFRCILLSRLYQHRMTIASPVHLFRKRLFSSIYMQRRISIVSFTLHSRFSASHSHEHSRKSTFRVHMPSGIKQYVSNASRYIRIVRFIPIFR